MDGSKYLSNYNHNVPQSKPQGCPTTTTTFHNRNHKVVQPQPQRATIETTRLSNHNHNVPQGSIWQSRVGTPVAGVVGLAEEHPGDRPGDTNGRHGDELDHQRDRT